MLHTNQVENEGRKIWSAPKVRRLSAGSAENANGTNPDSGGPGANRS